MNLGLALSGGGFRATAYHLGVLARLADENRLEEVTFLSTVSGGSLCVGLVYALNQFQCPSSQAYSATVLPQARRHMTGSEFQAGLLRRALRRPWRIFQTKAGEVSLLLQQGWGVTIKLHELPPRPRWMINATCYETGKNWRFERFRMGDYVFGYTNDTDIPLSDALAASAGFPGLIGPLVLPTARQRWFKYKARRVEVEAVEPDDLHKTEAVEPAFRRVHLWDGGVYDNHGLEGVHDFRSGWRLGIDFLLVSDGSGKAKAETYRLGAGVFLRIITGVMMDQIRSLRSRAVIERMTNHGDKGVYLTIGKACPAIIAAAGKSTELAHLCQTCLTEAEADRAENFPTVIRRLTDAEFELLFRHGYEVADCTLHAYYPDLFGHVAYRPVE
jgi:NTE family protein